MHKFNKRRRIRLFALVIFLVGCTRNHNGPILRLSSTHLGLTFLVRAAALLPVGPRPASWNHRCGRQPLLLCEKEINPEIRRSARRKRNAGLFGGATVKRSQERRSKNHDDADDDESALAERIRTDRKFLERNQHWILFVDDEEAIRQSVGDFLYDSGYQVTACADAHAAVQVCRNSTTPSFASSSTASGVLFPGGGPPSCIVADIRMPVGPSGIELLQWIRAQPNPALQRVPVVLLTAKGLTSDRIAGYQAGADVYLSKPFYPDELLSVVDNLIARRQEMVGDAGAMLDLQQDLANIQMLLQEQSRRTVVPTNVYLTPAEREVLELLCEGYTNAEIAAKRGTAQNYVTKTLQKIYRETETSTRTELLRWAVQTGYVSPKLS